MVSNSGLDLPIISSVNPYFLTLTAYPANVNKAINVGAKSASNTLTPYSADVNLNVNVAAKLAELILTHKQANINAGINVDCETATLTLTEYKSLVTIVDSTWVPRHKQGLLLRVVS